MRHCLLAFILFSSTVEADWNLVQESVNARLYFEPTSVQRNGSIVKLWVMYTYKTAQRMRDGTSYRSTKVQEEYDCATDRLRIVFYAAYSGVDGGGISVHSQNSIEEWRPAIPGTLGEYTLKFICGRL